MNEGLQFRTSAFGGFNKQDVMAYLEKSAREHSGKIAELQKDLAELRQARTEAEDAGETMKSRLAVLEAENQRLAADLAQREAAEEAESPSQDGGAPSQDGEAPGGSGDVGQQEEQ